MFYLGILNGIFASLVYFLYMETLDSCLGKSFDDSFSLNLILEMSTLSKGLICEVVVHENALNCINYKYTHISTARECHGIKRLLIPNMLFIVCCCSLYDT